MKLVQHARVICTMFPTCTHNLADGSLLKSTLIPTPSPPIHVALSCDSITLSVCLQESGLLKCYFYDTRGLAVQVRRWVYYYCIICIDQLELISLVYYREHLLILSLPSLSVKPRVRLYIFWNNAPFFTLSRLISPCLFNSLLYVYVLQVSSCVVFTGIP